MITVKAVEIRVEDIGKCICRIASFRAAKLGIEKIWGNEIPERNDIKIISRLPSLCSVQCFQYITGTGNNVPDVKSKGEFLLILSDGIEVKDLSSESIARLSQKIDISNWEFIIIRKSTNDAVKIQVEDNVFPADFFQLRQKVKGREIVTREEINEFRKMWGRVKEKFLIRENCKIFQVEN